MTTALLLDHTTDKKKKINREKVKRIVDLLPLIFSSGYIGEQGVLAGGTALNLEFEARRFPTDIDLQDVNADDLPFRKRFDYFADELRAASEGAGYEFRTHVARSPKGRLFYMNQFGEEDSFSVDICMGNMKTYGLPPVLKTYPETGEIRVLELEEMLGGKISMLSRPRLRGHKRYSDLLDVYNSISCSDINDGLLRKCFAYTMGRLGVKITSHKLREMVDWHDPARFSAGIAEKTDQELLFSDIRTGVIDRYRFLCSPGK